MVVNFQKKNESEINSLGEPYDFMSIMHYANNTFAKSDMFTTLLVTDKTKIEFEKLMGQRNYLSNGDIIQTNKLYQCEGNFLKVLKFSIWNLFKILTQGFTENFYNYQGAILLKKNNEYTNYFWRIRGSAGSTVNLKINEINIRTLGESCESSYIAIYDGYSKNSNLIAKICGSNVQNLEFKTTQSFMLINYVSKSLFDKMFHHFKATYTCK